MVRNLGTRQRRRLISRKRTIQIALGILVTVGCLVVALWDVEFEKIKSSFARANYATLPVLLIFLVFYFWLKAIRWRLLLKPAYPFTTYQLTPAMMIGFMGNNVLPAHLGELVRVFVLGREFAVPKTTIFSSVVLERLFDIIAILSVFGISMLLVPEMPESYKTWSVCASAFMLAAMALMFAYLFWTVRFLTVFEWMLKRLPLVSDGLRGRVLEMLEAGAVGLAALRSVRLLMGILITSFLQWGMMGVMVYVSLISFNIQVSPLASFVVVGVAALGVSVPASPGFFGIIQVCFQISLGLFGIGKEDAFAASIYYQLTQWIPITLVGLWYLNRKGLQLAKLGGAAGAGDAAGAASGSPEARTGAARDPDPDAESRKRVDASDPIPDPRNSS